MPYEQQGYNVWQLHAPSYSAGRPPDAPLCTSKVSYRSAGPDSAHVLLKAMASSLANARHLGQIALTCC